MTEQEFLAQADKRLKATPAAIRKINIRRNEIGLKQALDEAGIRNPGYYKWTKKYKKMGFLNEPTADAPPKARKKYTRKVNRAQTIDIPLTAADHSQKAVIIICPINQINEITGSLWK